MTQVQREAQARGASLGGFVPVQTASCVYNASQIEVRFNGVLLPTKDLSFTATIR